MYTKVNVLAPAQLCIEILNLTLTRMQVVYIIWIVRPTHWCWGY